MGFAQADIADLPQAPAALPSPIPTPPALGSAARWVGHQKTLRRCLSSWEDWPLGNVLCVSGQESCRN